MTPFMGVDGTYRHGDEIKWNQDTGLEYSVVLFPSGWEVLFLALIAIASAMMLVIFSACGSCCSSKKKEIGCRKPWYIFMLVTSWLLTVATVTCTLLRYFLHYSDKNK